MYRAQRGSARPPRTWRRHSVEPLSRAQGATPSRALAARRPRVPSSGMSASRVAAVVDPTPGIEGSTSARRLKVGSASMAASSSFSRALTLRSRILRRRRTWSAAALDSNS